MTPQTGPDLNAPPTPLLRNRDFVNYAICRLSASGAAQILTVTVGWELYVRTSSPFLLGMVGLAKFLPVLVLFLPAGVASDRFDRRRIIATAALVQAIAALGIGLVLLSPTQSIWPVFLLLSLHGAAEAFLFPALLSTLPGIVGRSQLPRAVATTSSIMKIGQLSAPALAGLMIAAIGPATIFAVSCLGVTTAVAALNINRILKVRSTVQFGIQLFFGGLRHIRNQPVLLGAVSLDMVAVMFGSVTVLLPVFAIDVLGVGPAELGLMRAAPAVGGLAMALLLANRQPLGHIGLWFFAATWASGLSIVVFSLSHVLWVSLAALVAYGAVDMFSVFVRHSVVQLFTPDELRGRVNAANGFVLNASNELGDFRAGTVASGIGAIPALALGAAVILTATVLWWRLFPELRRIDRL